MSRRKNYIPNKVLPKLTANAKKYHVVSCILAQKGDKLNIARLACQLKNLGNHALARDAFDELFQFSPLTKRVVWGNSCPKAIADLGNGENCYFFEPESLENEINWAILGLRPFKKLLRDFVILRDQVERHILLGNYYEATQLLEQSVKEFGYSVWYYEMRLTISGYQDRIDDCFAMLTHVNELFKEKKKMDIVPILLQDFCNRSITKSALQYDNILLSHYKRSRNNGNRIDYYLYRLNYYKYAHLDNLAEVIEMEHIQSAIDRYTILLYVLRSCYIYQDKQRPLALRSANQLYRLSGDRQLLPFVALNDLVMLPDSYYDATFIAILDNYYTGNYTETARLCRIYLERDPSNLYVVKLYCRSLMFLGNGFQSVTRDSNSLLHHIAFNTFKVMVEKENNQYIENLGTLAKKIYGLRMAAALDHFVKSEQREPHEDMMAYFSLLCFDPFFIRSFSNNEQQIEYLEKGLAHINDSSAIEYRKQCVERSISADSPVVAYIRDVDTAKITFERGEYEKALEQWQKIFEENKHSIPTSQTAVEYVFRSLVALGVEHRQEAVAFYVDCYIENRSFVSKVDTDKFLVDIKLSHYDGLRTGLDMMIFMFLNADNYPQKQFVLENYCRYRNVTYPSELINDLKRRNRQKVELFFSILLNDDILSHHYKLRSTINVLDEKLKIVNFLMSEHPENKTYSETYTELMHEIVAYRGMVRLDDSKIYVNEEAVMKYELCDIEPLYERFRKQAALAREGSSLLLVSGVSINDSGFTEILEDAASYSTDAVADVAMELFSVIRRAFLKSRFGLSTYLSTRIRHGVFEGEMRSFLARLDLILSLDQGNYVADTHWHRYRLDPASRDQLSESLRRFSRATDALILNFKDSVIQIRVDNKDSNGGLFCYEQPSEVVSRQLVKFESESANSQEFCHKVMDWLWQITEECLETVRGKVQSDLKPSFTNNILLLERGFEKIQSHTTLQADLQTAINQAREELTARIAKVENWFYRQEAKLEDFRLTDHIKMAFDTICKYSPDVPIELECKMPKQEPLFKAEFSASMFDLLSIFFSNIFKYSLEEQQRHMLLEVETDADGMMHMHLENKLRAGIDEQKQNEDFQSRISNEKLIQKEGGSGLAKAMNIIRYDFGDATNTYTIVAHEGMCLTDIHIHLANMTIDSSQNPEP